MDPIKTTNFKLTIMAESKLAKLSDIEKTAKSIETDLRWAESFYYILFDVLAPLQRLKSFYTNYMSLFLYAGWSLDIAYIVVLCKLFDKGPSIGLSMFIEQIKNLHPSYMLDIDKKEYDKFIDKNTVYLQDIDRIEKKLNPLRNTFRAHNYPNRKNPTLIWVQTKEWLNRAEEIFDEALISVGLTPWCEFLEDKMRHERNFLFDNIKTRSIEMAVNVRNKLQAPKTALGLLSQGKDVPKEFIEKARKDLDEAVELLKENFKK